jgi:Domain of unknown function (DUF4349)
MSSPEPIETRRVEALLRGSPPESTREAQLAGVMRELRGASEAPPELRERLRVLRPEPARSRWSPALKAALVVGVLVAVAGIGALALHGRGGSSGASSTAAGGGAVRGEPVPLPGRVRSAQKGTPPVELSAADAARTPTVPGGRIRDYGVWMRLRVPNSGALSDSVESAMRTTRQLGGYVADVDYGTRGSAGQAYLEVRVPVDRVQGAISRFAELGVLTGQQLLIQDRQADVDRLGHRIASLRQAVARTQEQLRSPNLSDAERARLENRLSRQRGLLKALTSRRASIVREAGYAKLALVLRIGTAAKKHAAPGRIERSARSALHALATVGAAAVYLAILLSPLLVIGVLAFLVRNTRRRRLDERLLERPRPASDPTP